jgi:hypothetical protein
MKIRVNGFGALLVVLLTVVNLGGLFYLAMEILTTDSYRGSTPGSFSMAEAAYLGALWTEVVAKACIGILLNLIVFGWILLNIKIDDQANELFRARVVAGMDTLKDLGRKELLMGDTISKQPSTIEKPQIQPLAPV